MTLLAAIVSVVVASVSSPAQPERSPCKFDDVVRAPDTAPAVPQPPTLSPDLSQVLLPANGMIVTVWFRVSPEGRVTGACVPDAPDAIREALIAAATRLRYSPALDGGRAVATVAAVRYQIPRRFRDRASQEHVGLSDDVAWLERIAGTAEGATAAWRTHVRPLGQPKDLRIVAYARLGEIGTPESLSAQKRIVSAMEQRSLLPLSVPLKTNWPHPGWHMGDHWPILLAQTETADGVRLVIIASDLLGPPQLFVLKCEKDDLVPCSRPKPLGPWTRQDATKVKAALREVAPGQLQLLLVQPSGSEARTFDLADVERDSDADGWTDVEERTLGLDPASQDSDGDGIDDAWDRAPVYAPPKAEAADEDVAILQAAIFAAFGLSESRWVLFARDDQVRKLEVAGLSAPVLFHRPLRYDVKAGIPGGVFVTWKILRKSGTEAIVEISDREGSLAAGGQNIFLRRVGRDWVVIGRQTTWLT